MKSEKRGDKNGILLINKPQGITSHDVVDCVRRKLRIKKVGHAGTLDPMATGLLILLLGKFTKRANLFMGYDKEYDGELLLGESTDTRDREGAIISKKDPEPYRSLLEDPENVIRKFKGAIKQVPPMYSAKKFKGKKLYELARKGITVPREPVTVCIKELRVSAISFPRISFYVRCSKGTYVRQLAHDIGEEIGCGAHLVKLERVGIGPYKISGALLLESLEEDERIFCESILQPE